MNIYMSDNVRPDAKLEDFWINFKTSIKKNLTKKEQQYIDNTSDYLNMLQGQEKYDEIQDCIQYYIKKTGRTIILNDMGHNAHILATNIKRLNRIINNDNSNSYNNKFYPLFNIYTLCKKKKCALYMDKIILLLRNYMEKSNTNYLAQIMNIAIENNQVSIIDNLRNILDVSNFLVDSTGFVDINKTRTIKLLKYLHTIETSSV